MNRSIGIMISTELSATDFSACGINMPKITYHDLGFEK